MFVQQMIVATKTNKRWKLKPKAPAEISNQLTEELKVSPIIAELLWQRGVNTFEDARRFFRPSLEHLHDPFLMKDMDLAVARIEKALVGNEKILVYGDYDVDGTTSVALVYSYFNDHYPERSAQGKLSYYIPDRYKEGYGISKQGIDYASKNNFTLIIALDCGIKAIEKVAYAKEKGIDFIICDHHRPGDVIPEAAAVLDPKRKDCNYPYKELSGCGLGFKLAQALSIKRNENVNTLEKYLDLVAISIASDIVPITGENRTLAYFGLKRLNEHPREGLKAILELANLKREVNITDIVFVIGPRINAAGRMESGNKAVELLVSDSEVDAAESGQHLNQNNEERKNLDQLTTQQALEMITSSPDLQKRKTTVLFDPSWHKGVIGIVASRLTETYYRPTIMLTESDGVVSGSARSVKDFDVYEALSACSDLLDQFGGHKYAAGLTLKPENVEAFQDKFEQVVSSEITDEMLIPEIEIDAELKLEEINSSFYNILRQFAPFGPGNMDPVFITNQVTDRGYANIVGRDHLKLDLIPINRPKGTGEKYLCFPAIGFDMGDMYDLVGNKQPVQVCFHLRDQEWQGKSFLQLQLKDLRRDESAD